MATWPYLIDADRLVFGVLKDRTGFLLTVESQGHPAIDIRLPLAYGPILLVQLQNMLGNAAVAPGGKPHIDPKAN